MDSFSASFDAALLAGDDTADQLSKELSSAGAALVGALSEEASLAALCCKHPDDELLYLKWARARQVVEECQEKYCACVDRSGYPDAGIRSVLEG
jgi:hypothetical protein